MRRRPLIVTGSAALAALAGVAGIASPGRSATGAPSKRGTADTRTLRIAFPSPETTLDPPQTQSDNNTVTLLSQILEAPLCYDYLARPVRLLPCTAVALPEVSADGRVFTLRIQPGILFSDHPAFGGSPRELVAADYVYALKRFYDPRWKSADLYIFESLKLPGLSELRQRAVQAKQPFDYDTEVEGARALDRYTLRITLGVSDPRFVYQLASAGVLGAVAREVVDFHGDDIGAHPVGTGAFMLKSWRRASQIELVRSPTWRGDRYHGTPADDPVAQRVAAQLRDQPLPRVDHVVVEIVEESQPRWLSFLNGSYDWLLVPGPFRAQAAPGGELAPYLAKRGMRLQAELDAAIAMSFFYMEHPLVGGYAPEKVALRRAIGLAFNGSAYIRNVLGGFGLPAQSTLAPFTSGYDPAYKSEMSDHDPARAKALLDLYGYTDRDGDGWREQPDGQPLTLVRSSAGSQLDRATNEIWKRSMDAVGLRMQFDISTWPELLKKTRAGGLMMWGYSWSAGSPDGGFFLAIAYGPNAAEANDPRFALPAFDHLFERQRELPEGAERAALMRRAQNLLVAYMPYKVHAHPQSLTLVQPWTTGYWRHPFMRDVWRFVGVDGSPTG